MEISRGEIIFLALIGCALIAKGIITFIAAVLG